MRLTQEERETHCWRDDRPGGGWGIETSSASMWQKLDRMFTATEARTDHGKVYGKCYEVPLNCVSFHKQRKGKPMTETQLLKLAKGRAAKRAAAVGAGNAGPS
ncbi:MAG: hypothetical protein WD024_01420 [Bacillota bacterium]